MIQKYGLYAAFAIIIALGAYVWYQDGVIEDGEQRIELLIAQRAACSASQENLKSAVINQNKLIAKFNIKLGETNKHLEDANTENQVLQGKVDKKIIELSQVQNDTCEDTINWMLEEAIDENKVIAD